MISTLQVDTRFWGLYLKLMKYVKLSTFSSFIFVGEVSLVSSPIFTWGISCHWNLGIQNLSFHLLSGVHKWYFCHVQSSSCWTLLKYFLRVKRLWCYKKVLLLCGGLLVYLQPSKFSFVGNWLDAAKSLVSCLLEVTNPPTRLSTPQFQAFLHNPLGHS